MRDRCIKKNEKLVVDAQLVLRFLLECYRQERNIRFRLIKEVFYSSSHQDVDGQVHFNFESFKTIFANNFKFCND